MHQVKYRIKTLAPVVISTTFGETNAVNTDNYIPGTTVLGMLAWRYLKRDNFNASDENVAADELFHRLFLDGAITFTNAYLTLKNRYEENVIFYPAPLSFRKDKSEKDIYDLLFVRDDFEKQTLPINHFITKDDLQEAQVTQELNHHHKRDRATGTPANGLLFTYEAIASDQVFSGKLTGQESDLRRLLSACGSKWIGHIGRSRNSQYGMVEFSFDAIEPVEADFQFDEDVVLTMLSHTLIYNECGFATTELNELQKHLHGAQINRAVVKSRHIENFVSVWKFKKPAETGFAAGSCFLLDITRADTEKLFNLQLTGLGERIHEGFGQIQLELAKNKEESFDLNPVDNPEMEKPGKTVPSRVNTIIKEIVDEAIENKIYLFAAEELKQFMSTEELIEKLPTGSLIRRLEMFLNSRKNEIDKFIDDINSLKDTATAQMERCNNKKVTFKSFLQGKPFKMNDILNRPDMAAIQKICDGIDYQPQHTPNEIAYLYFRAFLSQMRKRKKFI